MKKAFTLAEILITLGIVGIVAALTIPIFITNYKKHVLLKSLKANYSILQQAMETSLTENGFYEVNITTVENWFKTYLKPYLKIVKICYGESGCWHTEGNTKYLNGNNAYQDRGTLGLGYTTTMITFELTNGTQFSIDYYMKDRMVTYFGTEINNKTVSIGVYMDINGNKAPNIVGKDIFVLGYNEKGLRPAGAENNEAAIKNDCKKNGKGIFCLQYIIQNSWQIPNDYPW